MFTNFQITTIFISYFGALLIATLWHLKDKHIDKEEDTEAFPVLMSVFYWSAFSAFFLYLIINLYKNLGYDSSNALINNISIALEEIVKAFAIIIGLEIAGKRFNEVSDGVVYGIFAALGFIFIENIFYVLSFTNEVSREYFKYFFEKIIFGFSAHLTTVFFATFYAISYLKSPKLPNGNRPKPWHFINHIKFLGKGNYFIGILYFILSPAIFLINFFRKTQATMGIVLFGSFWISVILHIWYNNMVIYSKSAAFTMLFISGAVAFILYKRFDRLDN